MLPKNFPIAAVVIFLADSIAGPVSRDDTVFNIPKREVPNSVVFIGQPM